jgi:glucose dehydrogenase
MRIVLNILGGLIFLAGLVFFLQGINLLPGSYMTGDPQWAINGAVMMVVALLIFYFANRRREA